MMKIHSTLRDAYNELIESFDHPLESSSALRHVSTGDFLFPVWKKEGDETSWRWLHIRARRGDEEQHETGQVIVEYVRQEKLENTAWFCVRTAEDVAEFSAPLLVDCVGWKVAAHAQKGVALPPFPGMIPMPEMTSDTPDSAVVEES